MPRGRGWRRFRVSTLAMPTDDDHRCGFAIREMMVDRRFAALSEISRKPRRLTRVEALVWWLIPLVSGVVAVIWTSVLARRERRRNSPKWRAQRLAEVGHLLTDSVGRASGGRKPTGQGRPSRASSRQPVDGHRSGDSE